MVVIEQLSKKIKSNPLLTKQQEFDLAKAAQKGNKEARQKLIESNFRLVISIAKVYNNVNVNKNDLIQEGIIGLIKAVDKFDPDLGYRFSTYAYNWIKQSTLQYINETYSGIKVPTHSRLLNAKIVKKAKEIEEETGKMPSIKTLSEAMGMSAKKIKYTLKSNKRTTSIESSDNEENNRNYLNKIEDSSIYSNPEKVLETKELNRIIDESLSLLTAKEEKIIRLRFGINIAKENEINFPVTKEMRDYLVK
jgi:RNA polymerase primary sigma factor